MVAKILLVFFFLIFDRLVLTHHNVIQIYVPDHMMKYMQRVLESMPGLKYKTGVREYDRIPNEDDIDMNYYDDDRGRKVKINHESLYNRRKNRSIFTHAGYTSDADTCKVYNHNLLKVWTVLSKYTSDGYQEKPDNMALHNIALLVKAYLDHHDSMIDEEKKETTTVLPDVDITKNDVKTKVPEALNQIKKIINNAIDEEISNKIVELIVNKTSLPILEAEDSQCLIDVKRNLISNVNKEFEKYLFDSNCRRASIDIDLALNKNKVRQVLTPHSRKTVYEHKKMDHTEAKKFLRQWQDGEVENCDARAQLKFLERMGLTINEYILAQQCN